MATAPNLWTEAPLLGHPLSKQAAPWGCKAASPTERGPRGAQKGLHLAYSP